MTDLIYRAEQGVLAAMLQRLDQPESVRLLEADDFGYPPTAASTSPSPTPHWPSSTPPHSASSWPQPSTSLK
jgi:hypothetical protein